jgi:hypothetical protein
MAENLGIQDFEKRAQERVNAIPGERQAKEKELKQATETGMADIRGMQQMLGEAVGGVQGQYAGGVKEAQDVAARSAQDVAFAPTKENSAELTQLFGMLSTVAMMAGGKGRQSGMSALAAMTGAMEGYQKGRKDVFNNELKEFDKRIREVQLHNQNVRTKLNDALKTLQTDRDAGLAKLKGLEMDIQGSQAALNFRRGDIANGIKNLNTELNASTQTLSKYYERVQRAQQEANRLAAAERRHREALAQRERLSGGRQNALLAGRAENIREAFAQAAKDVENITKLPRNTVLGSFSGMAGKSGETLFESLRNTFARKVTQDEQRMAQQLLAGIEGHLAFALGGGYATSQSKARMDQYKEQIARAGDSPYIYATMLARLRQEMNVLSENFPSKPGATPEMNEKLQHYNDLVNKAVPFTVEDVIKAKFEKKGAPSPGGQEQRPSFNSVEEAERANLPKGTKIIVNGRPAEVQ